MSSVINLGAAARRYLASVSTKASPVNQQVVYHFVRWYGTERSLSSLSAPEVANYAERLSLSDKDYAQKLEQVRDFLLYARKEGWISTNIAIHLKPKKGKARPLTTAKAVPSDKVSLTSQGYANLKAELETLKSKRVEAIKEITKAAADKDFRENAPLEAAREQHGHLVGRIHELEAAIKSAVVAGDVKPAAVLKAGIGSTVVLTDLSTGEELCYTIVSPREVAPLAGRISNLSPVGKAVIGSEAGQNIEVVTPAGKCRYQVKSVEAK